MLSSLCDLPADPILSIAGRVRQDSRADRVDLGIGVYRDSEGATPVMQAVKAAEQRLVNEQRTKAYRGPEGDLDFVAAMLAEAFGIGTGLDGIQTVGGTGALSIAAQIVAQINPGAKVVLGTPTWPNHMPILLDAGLNVATYEHRATSDGSVDIGPMMASIATCRPGDLVLLHGCCHNPTGLDLSLAQWTDVAQAVAASGALPLVDLAYQGFGRSWSEDADAIRPLMDTVPEILLAYSCDKNFGLYRDRVGMLLGRAQNTTGTGRLVQHFASAARKSYSMPPDHGAATVRTILGDADLRSMWRAELGVMGQRLSGIRRAFALALNEAGVASSEIEAGLGMFAQMPISAEAVGRLAADHAIYMPASGRVNLAALTPSVIHRLANFLQAERVEPVL